MPDFYLEPTSFEGGRGFVVVRASDQQRLSWVSLPRRQGLRSLPVVGTSHRQDTLQDPGCAPPHELTLRAEPENEFSDHAVAVDRPDGVHLGYLPDDEARKLFRKVQRGDELKCLSIWESWSGRRRTGLRVLIAEAPATVKVLEWTEEEASPAGSSSGQSCLGTTASLAGLAFLAFLVVVLIAILLS